MMSVAERLHRDEFVEGGRAEYIVEASIIIRTIMESLGIDGAIVSTMALRDGLAMEAGRSLHIETILEPVFEPDGSSIPWGVS